MKHVTDIVLEKEALLLYRPIPVLIHANVDKTNDLLENGFH